MAENIYDINIASCIGQGGTKTAYLVSNDTVAFLPNQIDGKWLIDQWPRIIDDEIKMSQLLQKFQIPTLKFTLCQLRMTDGSLFSSYSCPSFESYEKTGNYIIDTKNSDSSRWPKDFTLSLFPPGAPKMDLDLWVDVLSPLLKDLDQIADNGFRLASDTLNLVFVKKGSQWHSGSQLPFEIRLFTFDFASKRFALDLSERTPLKFSQVYRMLRKLVEYAIWEELAPTKICLTTEQNEFRENLSNLCKTKLKTYDPNELR